MRALRLEDAFDRIDDLIAVQVAENGALSLAAALGVEEIERAVVRDRVAALAARGHTSSAASVLLGVLVGIFAAQLATPDSLNR